MTQYIEKSAVVAEIERRRKLISDPILSGDDLMIGERNALFNLLSFINTLEVKKVDSGKCEDGYVQGYEDAIDEACEWLEKKAILYVWKNCEQGKHGIHKTMLEDFRKAMKGGSQ